MPVNKKGEWVAPKLPKSLGACVDAYYDMRQARLAYEKGVDPLEKDEKFAKEHIINNVPKGDKGAVGQRYKGITYNEEMYQVEDWQKFYTWLQKTGNFQFLNRAINQAGVKDFLDEQTPPKRAPEDWKPKLPPGMKVFNAVKLSVTKL